MSEMLPIKLCDKHKVYHYSLEKVPCPECEVERLKAELSEANDLLSHWSICCECSDPVIDGTKEGGAYCSDCEDTTRELIKSLKGEVEKYEHIMQVVDELVKKILIARDRGQLLLDWEKDLLEAHRETKRAVSDVS